MSELLSCWNIFWISKATPETFVRCCRTLRAKLLWNKFWSSWSRTRTPKMTFFIILSRQKWHKNIELVISYPQTISTNLGVLSCAFWKSIEYRKSQTQTEKNESLFFVHLDLIFEPPFLNPQNPQAVCIFSSRNSPVKNRADGPSSVRNWDLSQKHSSANKIGLHIEMECITNWIDFFGSSFDSFQNNWHFWTKNMAHLSKSCHQFSHGSYIPLNNCIWMW